MHEHKHPESSCGPPGLEQGCVSPCAEEKQATPRTPVVMAGLPQHLAGGEHSKTSPHPSQWLLPPTATHKKPVNRQVFHKPKRTLVATKKPYNPVHEAVLLGEVHELFWNNENKDQASMCLKRVIGKQICPQAQIFKHTLPNFVQNPVPNFERFFADIPPR